MSNFCATCITGPAEVESDFEGKTYWLCRRCEDGADHSLPESVSHVESLLYERRLIGYIARHPEASPNEIAEVFAIELSPYQVGKGACAGRQRIYRARKRALGRAA